MKAFAAVLGIVLLGFAQSPRGRTDVKDTDLLRGIDQVKAGDFESAVLSLEAAIRRLGREPRVVGELALAFVYQGVAYLEMNETALAREKFHQALLREPSFRMDPFEFSPQQIRVFEAVVGQQSATALASPSPRRRPAKTLAIVAGGAAVAGGVAVAAGGGGRNSSASTPSPVQSTVPAATDIVLVGIEPPPGSRIPLVARRRLLSVRAIVVSEASGGFRLQAVLPNPSQMPAQALCLGGSSDAFSLRAGEIQEWGVLSSDPSSCPPLPFSTSELHVFLYRDSSEAAPVFSKIFAVNYTWIQ